MKFLKECVLFVWGCHLAKSIIDLLLYHMELVLVSS